MAGIRPRASGGRTISSGYRTSSTPNQGVGIGLPIAIAGCVPSREHESPIGLLRGDPSLAPLLLRDALGIDVPPFDRVDLGDSTFAQIEPSERRADLVVILRAAGADARTVLGIIIEVQKEPAPDKRRTWPLYLASLHARLGCQTCLVVIALDEKTARWAAEPITTLQRGLDFVPLVIGPRQMPRVSVEQAAERPWLAALAGFILGNGPDADDVIRAASAGFDALPVPERERVAWYDLLLSLLAEHPRQLLEQLMNPAGEKWKSAPFQHAYIEGREEGREEGSRRMLLALVDRHGAVDEGLRRRAIMCAADRLHGLALEIAAAPDRSGIEHVLASLPTSDDAG